MKKINNALIKDYTTYKLSGTIKEIIFPDNIEELKEIIQKLKGKKYRIIGNGSNLILSDSFDGTLIKLNSFDKLKIKDTTVTVGAGYSLPKLALECANHGLSGLEFASGIPGSIGGAIYMNAGAYGKDISSIIKNVTILDSSLNVKKININDLNLGYRDSVFKHNDYICLEAELQLSHGNKEDILDDIKKIIKSRKEKQPLEYPSAGSVFRNGPDYSAGRLIEKSGLKGLKVGDAEVSLKHANFIVNRGNASSDDIIKLIDIIKQTIKEKYNIDLILEQEIIK